MEIRKVLTVAALAVGSSAFADIERIEFLETSGTQWIDTGLKLNFRRSVYRLNFRVLDRGTSTATTGWAGMTDNKDSLGAGGKSFAVGQKKGSGATDIALIQWCTVGDSGGYFCPNSGSYNADCGWEFENDVAVSKFNGSNFGVNSKAPSRNGHAVGHYDSSKKDQESANTFYLGAVNNAGEGLYPFTVAPPKMQWYGAKFWTDGVLIGDFVPVKKDGVAGFYDTVTGTFFPSRSDDPFIAPEYIAWIGGNDGALTDAANWQGGAAPSSAHQVAVFPAGVAKHYTVSDHNAVLKNLGGINLVGADTLLWLDDINVDNTYAYAPLYGKGTYRLEKKSNDTRGMKLLASSCQFEGLFDLTNAYVYPSVPSALGVYGKAKARYHASWNQIRLYCSGNLLHADLQLGPTGQFVFTPGFTTFDGHLEFYSTSGASFHANGTASATFDCDIVNASATRRTLYLSSGTYYTGYSAKSRDFGKFQIQTANFGLNQPISFTRQDQSWVIYNQCNLALSNGGATGLKFGCENALNDETFVLMGYADHISLKKTCIINLNGYSQRVGMLGMYTESFDGTTVWNPNAVIKSETPATLTILETFRCDHSDGTGGYSSAYPGRVNGAASIILDDVPIVSPAGSTKRMRFNCPGSDTTGFLQANGGYIEIRPTATFSNLTALVATKTGLIKVNTPDVGNATNLLVSVTNATTAKIEIAADVTLKADTAFMGKRWLYVGRYSSVAGAGVQACPQLSGTGILEVKRYGGKSGFVIFFK